MNLNSMFSDKSKLIGSASSIQQNELVYKKIREGINPIILSYGEAPFVLSQFDMVQSDQWERGCHYSEGLGVPEFRNELAQYIRMTTGVEVSPETDILVASGSKIISYYIALSTLNPGDEIMLHEPSWVSYQEHARLNGAKTIFLPYNENVYGFEPLYKLNPNVKLIYINNPNNPRGLVYTKEEIQWLGRFCEENKIILAIDESYSDFVVDEFFYSGINLVGSNKMVVVFNSLSKNFGLSGWRLGYCVSNPYFIACINKFNQHLMTCASTNLQLALLGKLKSLYDEIKPQIQGLNEKRAEVLMLIRKHGFKPLEGSSTFYIFIDLSSYSFDAKSFVIDLLNNDNISFIPGNAYGRNLTKFIRLSFAIEPLERIDSALAVLKTRLLACG